MIPLSNLEIEQSINSINNLGFECTRKHIAPGDGTSQAILVGVDDETRNGKAIWVAEGFKM